VAEDTARSTTIEDLLLEVFDRLVGLPPDEIDKEIQPALGRVGTLLGVDRMILTELREDSALVVRHSWAETGVVRIHEGSLVASRLPRVFESIQQGRVVHIPDTTQLGQEWGLDREEFRRSGAKSHLSIPTAVGGALVGSLTLVRVREAKPWSEREIGRLELLARVFADAVSRRRSERQLRSAIAQVERMRARLEAENLYLRDEIEAEYGFENILGSSPGMERVLLVVEQVAPTDITVLIHGETGTGKELIARAIHRSSARNTRPLIKVNCAALPESLAESELFGHERGAFTGAVARRLGRFELADGGTLFLDEVGDLSSGVQAKLLRVLQDGEFERLGSSETRSTDVRVLAATSRDLPRAVQEGTYRADLFYRLSVVPIEIPPLRDRCEDIPALVWHFIERARARYGRRIKDVPVQVMEALEAYSWPGNVRELESIIERSIVLSQGGRLVLQALPFPDPSVDPSAGSRSEALEAVERAHIIRVLERCGWKVKGSGNAAERLGLHDSTLRGRMRKLGIERPSA
jgi:transcriptional regulator with GAF, ATPase, and Fis domain